MIMYVLWLITSAYAVPMGAYPDVPTCARLLVQAETAFIRPPRAVLAKVICVPTFVLPGMRPQLPPAVLKPGPQA